MEIKPVDDGVMFDFLTKKLRKLADDGASQEEAIEEFVTSSVAMLTQGIFAAKGMLKGLASDEWVVDRFEAGAMLVAKVVTHVYGVQCVFSREGLSCELKIPTSQGLMSVEFGKTECPAT